MRLPEDPGVESVIDAIPLKTEVISRENAQAAFQFSFGIVDRWTDPDRKRRADLIGNNRIDAGVKQLAIFGERAEGVVVFSPIEGQTIRRINAQPEREPRVLG